MQLHAQTLRRAELPDALSGQMLALMQAHYDNVAPEQFHADLATKQWIILLFEGGVLRGFSTQAVFDHEFDGRMVRVIFSGDTIIDRDYWGSWALPVAWAKLTLGLASTSRLPLYWLLTSKGYKTYRFLSVFFRRFLPSCDHAAPDFDQRLLTSVAAARFGPRFDARSGILNADGNAQRLKPGVAEIDDPRRKDRHIAFFEKRNPGHAHGDELVCLAQCCEENLHPFILRRLRP